MPTKSGAKDKATPPRKECTCPENLWTGSEINDSMCELTDEEHEELWGKKTMSETLAFQWLTDNGYPTCGMSQMKGFTTFYLEPILEAYWKFRKERDSQTKG